MTTTPSVRRGLRISVLSLVWTLVAGTCAVAVGVVGRSLVLVSFGAIGLIDAIGSASLTLHFRHALLHEAISARSERVSHVLVTLGMALVGVATMGDGAYRLGTGTTARSEIPGVVLAGVSVVVLAVLSLRKRRIAKVIPSSALDADGWLSATGSALALVVLTGTGLQTQLGWWWADPAAATVVGAAAVGLSCVLTSQR